MRHGYPDYPRCPVVGDQCDDPGCPKGTGCVLRDPAKLHRWCVGRPDHWKAPQVLLEAFDPVV